MTLFCARVWEFLIFGPKFGILDMPSWLYLQFFTQNPNLQSELTNSFTQRRKLRKTNLRESRFLIVKFLIIRLHRIFGPNLRFPDIWRCALGGFLHAEFDFAVKNSQFLQLNLKNQDSKFRFEKKKLKSSQLGTRKPNMDRIGTKIEEIASRTFLDRSEPCKMRRKR